MSLLRRTLAVVIAVSCGFTVGADTSWISGGSGSWSNPANWSSGLPGEIQGTTTINNSGNKTVLLDSSASALNRVVQRLNVSNSSGTNTLLISGVELSLRNTLTVDRGGAVVITNGGSMRLAGGAGTGLNINAGSISVTNGSIYSLDATTRVGRVTSGMLEIAGGTTQLGDVLVGDFPGSSGFVLVNGGVLNVASNLVVADDVGSTGAVYVASGELTMSNSNGVVRVGDDNVGQLAVYGGTVRLEGDELTIGRRTNSVGFLLIAGGTTITTDISLGRFLGATGLVMVTGGELLATNDSLRIGREGFGQFLISNGVVRANDAGVALSPTATGLLRIYGGEVHLQSNLVVNGICDVNGGTLSAGQLYFTNSAGTVFFSSGTIRSGGAVVSNGVPFVIGDGVHAATYHMEGGVHAFADGLVISPNATLSGCGTVIGNVVNNGTILTNCGGAVSPRIVNAQHSATSFSFSFQSQGGVTYLIQYKTNLEDPSWSTLETRTGDGTVLNVSDPVALAARRFYRIEVP
jgi:T5SS/PEP-CTERM-associated repeat protein